MTKWGVMTALLASACFEVVPASTSDAGMATDARVGTSDGGRRPDGAIVDGSVRPDAASPDDAPLDAAAPNDAPPIAECDAPMSAPDFQRTQLTITSAGTHTITLAPVPTLKLAYDFASPSAAHLTTRIREAATGQLVAEPYEKPCAGLANGNYEIEAFSTQSTSEHANLVRWTHSTVTVSGPTTKSIAIPAMPAASSKPVTVDLTTLGTFTGTRYVYVVMLTPSHDLYAIGGLADVGTRTQWEFTLGLPDVTLAPLVWVQDYPSAESEVASWKQVTFEWPSRPAATSYALTLPALAHVNATFSDPSSAANPYFLQCEKTARPDLFLHRAAARRPDAMTARLPVWPGVQCDLFADATVSFGRAAQLSFPIANRERITATGTLARNFTVPSVPAGVATTLRLEDADGNDPATSYSTYAVGTPTGMSNAQLVVDLFAGTSELPPGTYQIEVQRTSSRDLKRAGAPVFELPVRR